MSLVPSGMMTSAAGILEPSIRSTLPSGCGSPPSGTREPSSFWQPEGSLEPAGHRKDGTSLRRVVPGSTASSETSNSGMLNSSSGASIDEEEV